MIMMLKEWPLGAQLVAQCNYPDEKQRRLAWSGGIALEQ